MEYFSLRTRCLEIDENSISKLMQTLNHIRAPSIRIRFVPFRWYPRPGMDESIVSYRVYSPVASARLYRYKRRIPADVPVVDYRPTGFLDPRICVTVRKRGKESRGSVTGTGSLPTRSSSFSFVGERQVLRHLFTLPISSLSLFLLFRQRI